jgi:hypothetical protein
LAIVVAGACDDRSPGAGTGPDLPMLAFRDTVTIGGASAQGAAAFGSIVAAALLSDDAGLVVADGQTQELHVFSLAGDHLRRFSGRGGGPGEHRAVHDVWGAADGGVCTWDIQTTRVTHFDAHGQVVGSGRADLDDMEAIRPSFAGFFDDCGFVLEDERSTMGMRGVPEGMRRDTVRFVRYRSDGSAQRTLLRRPDAETWFRNRDGGWGPVRLVFGEALFGFPRGREFWVGTSDEPGWTRLDMAGDTLGQLVLPYEPRRATAKDVERERDRRVGEVVASHRLLPGFPDMSERIAQSRREAIAAVAARNYPRPSESDATWFLLDSTNTRRGELALARSDSIVAGSPGTVLVKSRDSMDAALIRILRR